jgi:putative addiction module component (TIGR02574 family)
VSGSARLDGRMRPSLRDSWLVYTDSMSGSADKTESGSVHEAWDAEVARRIEDLKAGKAVTVPWEELHRELLALE